VDVTGPQSPLVVACGFQKIDDAQPNVGGTLSIKSVGGPFGGDSSRGFVPFQRNFMARHPPNGVRSVFGFGPVSQPFTSLSHVSGSLKLMTARERKKTVFDKLTTRIGNTLSNADFRAAGLEIKLAKQESQLTFQVSKGNPYALGEVALIREASTDLQSPNWSYTPSEKLGYLFFGDEKPSAKDSLEVTIYSGLTEIAVPFVFDDLTVPPVPPPETEK